MMNGIRAAAALGAFAAVFSSTAPALADGSPRTVSDYYDAMQASATRLEAQVAERQKIGDMAAAQRLALAAAMVLRTASEFRGAEQDFMLDDVNNLPAPVPARIDEALQKATAAELAAPQHAAFIDEAQLTFNALLAVLPWKTPHPVLYGMLSNDLADTGEPLPADVVFYGFRLIDPIYKTPPIVSYGRTEFPASTVKVKDDRIEAQLPESVKQAVHFGPSPCESRPEFGLRAHFVYAERRGFWPFVWHVQDESNMDVFALPTPTIYAASVTTTSQVSATTSTLETFEQRSSVANADCELTKSVDVSFALPAEAADAKCSASWVDATGATKLSSACKIEGKTAHAVGAISGGRKVCSPDNLCTCSVPAQGWLEARGSYHMPQTTSAMTVDKIPTLVTFPAGGSAEARIPVSDDRKLRHLALSITRRACATVLDTVDINLGDDPDAQSAGVSATGDFRASIKAGALKVGATEAFALDRRSAP